VITENVLQGSAEWQSARVGLPTASMFDKIVTTKGEPSKQAIKYLFQLAAERITGKKEESYQNGAMQRGIEMESEARSMYELITGNVVEQVGVCYPDKKKLYGCSPDGLVGDDGIIEIKCPSSAVHVGYLLEGVLPIDYFQQIHGQLLVTGRKWADFFSFYPGLRPLLVRVEPDKKFIDALKKELISFNKELDRITDKIRGEK
jgi:predicted phage-related endonuclease